jgi:hypothetical protein
MSAPHKSLMQGPGWTEPCHSCGGIDGKHQWGGPFECSGEWDPWTSEDRKLQTILWELRAIHKALEKRGGGTL